MSDVLAAAFMLVLSVIVILATWSLGYWSDLTAGPAFAPVWIAAAGVFLVILYLMQAWWAGVDTGVEWPDRTALARIGLTMGGLIAIPLLSPVLGMVPSVAAFIVFFLLVVARRGLVPALTTAAVTTGLVYGVFVWWLALPLPKGLFGV